LTALLICWVLFPLVLGLLCVGCGLFLEYAAGVRLGVLLAPAGLAAIVVVAGLATTTEATAKLAVPAVVALAVAGLGLSLPWKRRRLDIWAVVGAVGAFAVYAAPIVLSGRATFAGYIKLDDTATWLAITDRVMQHGRDVSGLAPSSYEATVDAYIGQTGYPVGSVVPLGVARALVGQDAAWVFQPYLAFQAAMLALGSYAVISRLIDSRRVRAVAVFVAAQAALLYAYSLWGAVKELTTAPFLALLAALVVKALREPVGTRSLIPLAVAVSATLGVLNVGGGVWLGLALVPALGLAARIPARVFLVRAAVFAALTCLLSIPTLLTARAFLGPASHTLTSGTEFGNLNGPLSPLQFFGIWPVGDFRGRPGDMGPTYFLIAVLCAAAVWALVAAWRRGAWELLLYVGIAAVGCVILTSFGSPWVDAKVLATASPAPVLAGMAGAAAVWQGGRRVEALVLAAAIAGGVTWSNVLAYHDVWLAPRAQLSELETIGKRFAGQGPTLMTEFQPYGVRHFLRDLDPEGASEFRRRRIPLRNGSLVQSGFSADVDRFQLDALLVYRTLVLLRSPAASRPPSVYRLVWQARFYEVWQRPEQVSSRILEHLPLGLENVQAGATPRCNDVLRLGRLAGEHGGFLADVRRSPPTIVQLAQASYPRSWRAGGDPGSFYPSPGTLDASAVIPKTGRYGIWLGGSFRRSVELWVDGRLVASARHQLNHPDQYTPLGEIGLSAGPHRVVLRYRAANLRPGSGGPAFALGPLVLSRETADVPVTYVPAAKARTLCGKNLDWLEAVSA
jgi:hypothetical protein